MLVSDLDDVEGSEKDHEREDVRDPAVGGLLAWGHGVPTGSGFDAGRQFLPPYWRLRERTEPTRDPTAASTFRYAHDPVPKIASSSWSQEFSPLPGMGMPPGTSILMLVAECQTKG